MFATSQVARMKMLAAALFGVAILSTALTSASTSDQQLRLFCGYGEPCGSRTNDAISYSVIVITKRSNASLLQRS